MNIVEMNQAVLRLDETPGIGEILMGRWCAWPIAKRHINQALRDRFVDRSDGAERRQSARARWRFRVEKARWATIGAAQFVRHSGLRRSPHVLVLTHGKNRRERDAEGRYVDVFLDSLLNSGALRLPPFVVEEATGWGHPSPPAGPRHLFHEFLATSTSVFAKLESIHRAALAPAADLARIAVESGIPVPEARLRERLARGLVAFEARRRSSLRFLSRSRARGVMLVMAPLASIAAARELGLPVFEFQHGSMGTEHPSYQWSGALASVRDRMPVPTHLLTFGELWRNLLLQRGFWRADEVFAVGGARMERHLEAAKRRTRPDRPFSVLYLSQWPCRSAAAAFWDDALRVSAARGIAFDLAIKLHPSERRQGAEYRAVAARHPTRCRVLDAEENAYELILGSDMVVSHSSTGLIESAALGVPTVSLCLGAIPSGIAGMTNIPELKDAIVHIATIEEFLDLTVRFPAGSAAFDAWASETERKGSRFYARGFIANAAAVINDATAS